MHSLSAYQLLSKYQYTTSSRKLIIILMVVIMLGAMLQIWVLNRMATLGEQLTRIELLKSDISMENQLLENTIAEGSSMQNVRIFATNLGFTSAKTIKYIETPDIASSN